MPNWDIVILAAGGSTRMGDNLKQLLEINGKSLLDHTVECAVDLQPNRIHIVLGAHANQIAASVTKETRLNFILNEDWQAGMGTSVAIACQQIMKDKASLPDGIMILLVDQPLVVKGRDYLRQLITKWYEHPDKICGSDYGKKIGVPCVFPSRLINELSRLEGDKGARTLLNSGEELIKTLSIGDLGLDIDTLDDYEKVVEVWSGKNDDSR